MFGFLHRWLGRRPWSELVHWALDLETTGLDPQKDEILSCGMVPIRGGAILWGERIYHRIRPRGDGTSNAIAIHGLLPNEAADALSLDQLVQDLHQRLQGCALVLHWARLDLTLLRQAFRRHHTPWPNPTVYDTAHLLSQLDRRRSLIEPHAQPLPTQLAQARQALGLPPHPEHHALTDALATAELYLALRGRLE